MEKKRESRNEEDRTENVSVDIPDTSVEFPNLANPPVPTSGERYEVLPSNLMAPTGTRPVRKILFASPSNGDGSSEVAIQYAYSIASDSQWKVLLVDAKLSNPNFVKRFDIDPAMKGLTDLIKDGGIATVFKKADHNNVYILPIGTHPNSTSNILRRAQFDNFMESAGLHFDYIIIDGPPILKSPVCRVIGPKVDGVIMVLDAGKTRHQVALRAKQELEFCHAKILGVILNKRKYHIPKWIYDRL